MVNKYRGEVPISLGEESHKMIPSFEAMVEIEDKTNQCIFELMRDIVENHRLKISTATAVVTAGINASRKEMKLPTYSYEWVGQQIFKDGIMSVLPAVRDFLIRCISSEKDLEETEEVTGNE